MDELKKLERENGEKIDKLNQGIVDLTLALKDVQNSIELDRMATKNNDKMLSVAIERVTAIQEKQDTRIENLEHYNNGLERQKAKAVGFLAAIGMTGGAIGSYVAKFLGIFH